MTGFDLRRAAEHLEVRVPEFLEELRLLVSLDSGTFDKAGVDAVCALMRQRYERMGGTVRVYPNDAYGDVLLSIWEGAGGGSILLLGHLDTVYGPGTAAQRPLHVDGSRAVGPGTSDMKAGDLAIAYALETLFEQGWRQFGRVEVLHNADEEIGSPASRDLVRARAEEADAVLVLEAGRESGDLVSARKGIVKCEVEVQGRPAHAGVNHHMGRNAALELAHLVVALEGINGTLPGVTVNVGRIEGGERVNVVPDLARAHLELRAFEREYLLAAADRVREVVAHRTVPDTVAHVEVEIEHYPMQKSEASARILERAQAVAAELGFTVGDTATGGASDGNTAAAAGTPVLDGLGPIGGGAHSPKEYVSIPSIAPRTALLAGLLANLGRDPGGA